MNTLTVSTIGLFHRIGFVKDTGTLFSIGRATSQQLLYSGRISESNFLYDAIDGGKRSAIPAVTRDRFGKSLYFFAGNPIGLLMLDLMATISEWAYLPEIYVYVHWWFTIFFCLAGQKIFFGNLRMYDFKRSSF